MDKIRKVSKETEIYGGAILSDLMCDFRYLEFY
jgi:hypothetical protein